MNSTVTAVESLFLGSTISQDLKWDNHIDSMVKKAQQRLYFLRLLTKLCFLLLKMQIYLVFPFLELIWQYRGLLFLSVNSNWAVWCKWGRGRCDEPERTAQWKLCLINVACLVILDQDEPINVSELRSSQLYPVQWSGHTHTLQRFQLEPSVQQHSRIYVQVTDGKQLPSWTKGHPVHFAPC